MAPLDHANNVVYSNESLLLFMAVIIVAISIVKNYSSDVEQIKKDIDEVNNQGEMF